MRKSLQKVRLKISFDGENELLHPKFMYSKVHVNCNAELQNNDFTLALSRHIPVYKIPGYYKRNTHFQCCIETKLLMI